MKRKSSLSDKLCKMISESELKSCQDISPVLIPSLLSDLPTKFENKLKIQEKFYLEKTKTY